VSTPGRRDRDESSASPSPRALRAAALLGHVATAEREPAQASARRRAERAAATLHASLGFGEIALVTGPSGAGKSTILGALRRRVSAARGDPVLDPRAGTADEHGWRVRASSSGEQGRRAVIDALPGPLEGALSALARAGLAEAALLARPIGALSEGERFRLGVARAIHEAGRRGPPHADGVCHPWILIDECCAVLDRVTAEGVARSLGRWARASGARVACATARDELIEALQPDLLMWVGLGQEPELARAGPGRAARADSGAQRAITIPPDVLARFERSRAREDAGGVPGSIRIEPGTRSDYRSLARFHYRAADPATLAGVRRATDTRTDETIGVLVVSHPTLNGAWRELAWPGRYAGGSKRAHAARLNAEVRCLSRVIVDPRYRGFGVARAMVRAYLDDPMTPATEAIAAMGRVCPFFKRAGMVEYELTPRAPDARLIDALEHAGFEAWTLLDPCRRRAAARDPLLTRELRRWAGASRATRRMSGLSPEELAREAARSIGAATRAYAHTRGM